MEHLHLFGDDRSTWVAWLVNLDQAWLVGCRSEHGCLAYEVEVYLSVDALQLVLDEQRHLDVFVRVELEQLLLDYFEIVGVQLVHEENKHFFAFLDQVPCFGVLVNHSLHCVQVLERDVD